MGSQLPEWSVRKVWHPLDLPKGLSHGAPGAELCNVAVGGFEGCTRHTARSGRRQVEGMPHRFRSG